MSVVLLITEQEEAIPLSRWAFYFAQAKSCPVHMVFISGKEACELTQCWVESEDLLIRGLFDLRKELMDKEANHPTHPPVMYMAEDETEHEKPYVTEMKVYKLGRKNAQAEIKKMLSQEKVSLLLAGKHGSSRKNEDRLLLELYEECPCDTMLLRLGDGDGKAKNKILIPTGGEPNSLGALSLGAGMANEGSVVTPLMIEPNADDLMQDVGKKLLDQSIKKAGVKEINYNFTPRVDLAEDVTEGLQSAFKEGYDLVILGAPEGSAVKRMLFGTLPDRLLKGDRATTVAVFCRAQPMVMRLAKTISTFLDLQVPNLDREGRIELFELLQKNSQWGFDFMALISLSTCIAALGLLSNSGAVVIGAMLVAPLMTPLLGSGLALVQGNLPLILKASRAILFGFLMAVGIGFLSGLVGYVLLPGEELSGEILARGRPTLLDMGIAFLSGVAAAYCTGRKGLSGALPGVAISAALVPPIASAGIALAYGQFSISQGAILLFVTNVIAIILGASFAFYASGIRPQRGSENLKWVRKVIMSLIVASVVVLIPLTVFLYSKVSKQIAVQTDLTPALRVNLDSYMAKKKGMRILSLSQRKSAETLEVSIHLECAQLPKPSLAGELKKLIQTQLLKENIEHRHDELLQRKIVVKVLPKYVLYSE